MHQFTVLWQYIPLLLYLFWSLAAGAAVVALLPLKAATSFREAVLLSSKRGKTWEERPQRWLGVLSGVSVPQAWFRHFYNLGVLSIAAVLAAYIRYLGLSQRNDANLQQQGRTLLALLLLSVHLVRRCLESNFLAKYPAGARMHVIAYLFGLVYYTALPLTILPHHLFQYGEKGSAPLLSNASDVFEAMAVSLSPLTVVGAMIFLAGNALQYQCHSILADLQAGQLSRQTAVGKQESTVYRIPRGGAFEYISCPHYLAEIVIYLGLALLCTKNGLMIWLPFIWVVANLILAAGPTHAWYKRHFEEYPTERRALIPFLC